MKKFGCTGLLMLVAGGILFAQRSQTPSADESKILALESAWNLAEEEKNTGALDQMLAGTFVYTEYDGSFSDKSQFLKNVKSAPIYSDQITNQDTAVTVYTNLVAPMYTTRAAIPLLRAAGGGDIMNISSEITLDYLPMMTLYAATKRGLNGFTEAMNHELRRDSIRVTLVILGAVGDTGIHENFGPGDLERAWPVWEADGYLTRMSGTQLLTSARVAEVLYDVLTRPRDLMMDVIHVRPASS